MDFIIKKLLSSDLSIAKQLIILWQIEDGILNPTILNGRLHAGFTFKRLLSCFCRYGR